MARIITDGFDGDGLGVALPAPIRAPAPAPVLQPVWDFITGAYETVAAPVALPAGISDGIGAPGQFYTNTNLGAKGEGLDGAGSGVSFEQLTPSFLQSIGFSGPATVQQGSGESFEIVKNPALTDFLASTKQTVAQTYVSEQSNDYQLQTFDQAGAKVGESVTFHNANDDAFGVVAAIIAILGTAGIASGYIGAGQAVTVGGGATAAVGEGTTVAVGNGAFLGEGVASGVSAWDAAYVGVGGVLTGAGGTGIALASDAIAGAGPAVGNGAFLGENVASGVPAWDAAATNAGLTLTTTAAPLASTVASSTAPAAASSTATLGDLASGATKLIDYVGKAIGIAGALDAAGKPKGNTSGPAPGAAQPTSALPVLLGLGAVLLFAFKG